MLKKQNSSNLFTRLLQPKRALPIVIVLLFAAGGTYVVIGANAFSGGSVSFDATQAAQTRAPGDVYDLILEADIPDYPSPQLQVWVSLYSDASKAKYIGYFCGAQGQCMNGEDYITLVSEADKSKDLDICINVHRGVPNDYDEHLHLLTVRYQALQTTQHSLWQPQAQWLTGTCGTIGTPIVNQGIKGKNGPNGAGSDTEIKTGTKDVGTDSGNGGTGSAKGVGGGSGSLATTQTSVPSSVPASTAQGQAMKQPAIQPSPFFDGREYSPGSNADNILFSTSVGGKRVVKLWGYIIILLFIVGAFATYFLWWRLKHKVSTPIKRPKKKLK